MTHLITTLTAATAATMLLTACTSPRGFPADHQILNFDKVDERLYRGAQPNRNGFEYLHSIGVKSVVNLLAENDTLPDEPRTVRTLGMTYVQVPLSGIRSPKKERIEEILGIIDRLPGPVFLHCKFGMDRTGTCVACWRIRMHHWLPTDALREAEKYGLSVWEPGMKNFILNFE